RLAAARTREHGGPGPDPAGLDDDPEYDVELRRHRAHVRAPQARQRRHARARLPPVEVLPRVDDQQVDRRALPRPANGGHRGGRGDQESGVARRSLSKGLVTKLHIGSGPQILPGWVNVDNLPYPGVDKVLDVTAGLPFRDVDFIFAEH